MKRNVYLVISDLHASYRNKKSRVDYLNEVDYVIDNLMRIIDTYKSDTVNLIFLGDVADNSFKDQAKAIAFNNIFVILKQKVKEIYFVMGNHEMTYYRDNPFWSLFNTIESEEIRKVITKSWQPTGLLQIGRVIDRLEDGNVCFTFNHHATRVLRPVEGKTNIGLFHKDIVCKAIMEDMKINNDLDIFEVKPVYIEKSNILNGYDYCFFGHVHKIYGRWVYTDDVTGDKIRLNYLGSLGRPNHTEVNDKFLERDIPAIIVNNGELETIEHNLFNLPSRKETVKEDIIEHNQKLYQQRKDYNYFKEYMEISDNPIENIKARLSVSPDSLLIFEDYIKSSNPEFEQELKSRVEELKWL